MIPIEIHGLFHTYHNTSHPPKYHLTSHDLSVPNDQTNRRYDAGEACVPESEERDFGKC